MLGCQGTLSNISTPFLLILTSLFVQKLRWIKATEAEISSYNVHERQQEKPGRQTDDKQYVWFLKASLGLTFSWTEGILNFASIDRYLPWSRFIASYLMPTMYSLQVIPSWSCLCVSWLIAEPFPFPNSTYPSTLRRQRSLKQKLLWRPSNSCFCHFLSPFSLVVAGYYGVASAVAPPETTTRQDCRLCLPDQQQKQRTSRLTWFMCKLQRAIILYPRW